MAYYIKDIIGSINMKKFLLISLLLIVLLLAGGLGGLYYYVNTDSFRTQVRSMIIDNIQKVTGRKASLGDVSGTIFGKFHIGKLTIKEADEKSDFVTVESIYLQPELMALLKKQIKIKSITVSKPSIKVIKTGEKFNFTDILDRIKANSTDEKSSISLNIDTLGVKGASITLNLGKDNEIKVEDIDLIVAPGDLKTITGTLNNLKLIHAQIKKPVTLKNVKFSLKDFDDFEISSGNIISDIINLAFSGKYSDIKSEPLVDFNVNIPEIDLVKLLPIAREYSKHSALNSVSFEGSNIIKNVQAKIVGKVAGQVKDWKFDASGKVKLAGGKYEKASFKGIDWDVKLKDKILEVIQNSGTTVSAKYAAFPEIGMKNLNLKGDLEKITINKLDIMGMSITGTLKDKSIFDLKVKGDKKVAELLEFFPDPKIKELSPAGNVNMDLAFAGNVNKPEALALNGKISLDVSLKPMKKSEMKLKAEILCNKQEITFKTCKWNLGDMANGEVTGSINGFKNPSLNLVKKNKFPILEALFAEIGMKNLKLIGSGDADFIVKGTVTKPAVTGNLNLASGTFWYKGEPEKGQPEPNPFELPYDSMKSKLSYDGKAARITSAILTLLGGEITAKAELDTFTKDMLLKADLKSTKHIKIEQLLAKSPTMQKFINGSGSVEMVINAKASNLIPTLSGKGKARVLKGKINLPIEKIPQLQGIKALETLVYEEIYADVNITRGIIHFGPTKTYASSKLFAKAALFSSTGFGTLNLNDFMANISGTVKVHPDLLKNSQYDVTEQLKKLGGNQGLIDSAMKIIEKEGGIPVSFTIKGIVPDDQVISPDTGAISGFIGKIFAEMAKDMIKQKLLGKGADLLKGKGGDLLKGKGGDLLNGLLGGNKTPAPTTTTPAPAPATDVKTKIEDKLKSGLLKKFGF